MSPNKPNKTQMILTGTTGWFNAGVVAKRSLYNFLYIAGVGS